MFKQAQTIPDPSYPPLYSKMSRQNRFKVYRFKFSRPNRKPTEILHKPHRNPTATPTEPQLTPTKSCFFPFQHFTLPCKHCKSFLAQVGQLKLVSWWLNTSYVSPAGHSINVHICTSSKKHILLKQIFKQILKTSYC